MGNPPPHAAIRASVGIPAKSDGSPWIKLKKSCVETPSRAVYALFCAISMVGIGAPSIRLNALRLPPSSTIVTFSLTPSSLAFATAAFTIFCASSEEMLCFLTTLVIGIVPPLDLLLRFDYPCTSRNRGALELVRDHPSIHWDGGTRHVRRIWRSDKGDHVSDLLRCCETFHGHGGDERRFIFICIGEACEHTCICCAYSDCIYSDSSPCDFQRGGFCQALHRMFAGYVNGCSGGTDPSICRRDIDDAPASLWQHHPQFVLHAEQRAQDVCVEGRGVSLCSLFRHRAGCAFGSSAIDSSIQATKARDSLVDECPDIIVVSNVGFYEFDFCAKCA